MTLLSRNPINSLRNLPYKRNQYTSVGVLEKKENLIPSEAATKRIQHSEDIQSNISLGMIGLVNFNFDVY
jgi:hypothetical protein